MEKPQRTDTERLDWLIANEYQVCEIPAKSGKKPPMFRVWRPSDNTWEPNDEPVSDGFENPRDAIDKAMDDESL